MTPAPQSRRTVLLLLLVVVSLSCMKIPNMKQNLGTTVDPNQVLNLMADSWGAGDATSVNANDFVSMTKTLQLADNPPQLTMNKGITVAQKTTTSVGFDLDLIIQSQEFVSNNQAQASAFERTISFQVDSSSGNPSPPPAPVAPSALINNFAKRTVRQLDTENDIEVTPYELFLGIANVCAGSGVKCYKLTQVDQQVAVPPSIAQQLGCTAGATNCTWTIRTVEFVAETVSTDPTTGQKDTNDTWVHLEFAPSAPYLFRLTNYCLEALTTYQGQQFTLRQCQTMSDMQSGGNSTK